MPHQQFRIQKLSETSPALVGKSQFNLGTDTGSFHNVSPKKGIPPSSKAIVGLPSARFAHGNSLKSSLLIHVFLLCFNFQQFF
jgi:hypothetical protein